MGRTVDVVSKGCEYGGSESIYRVAPVLRRAELLLLVPSHFCSENPQISMKEQSYRKLL